MHLLETRPYLDPEPPLSRVWVFTPRAKGQNLGASENVPGFRGWQYAFCFVNFEKFFSSILLSRAGVWACGCCIYGAHTCESPSYIVAELWKCISGNETRTCLISQRGGPVKIRGRTLFHREGEGKERGPGII